MTKKKELLRRIQLKNQYVILKAQEIDRLFNKFLQQSRSVSENRQNQTGREV